MKKTDKIKEICCSWLNFPNSYMGFILGLFIASGMLFSWQPVNAQCTNSPSVPLGIQPVEVPGNPALCDGGVREENPVSTTYDLGGVGTVTVVMSSSNCGEVFSWEVSPGIEIDQIIVKGGPNANLYDYTGISPRPTSDGFLHSPIGPSGDFYGVSHIDFCFRFVPPPIECELVVDADILCKGEEDGEMTLSWTGGVGPFSVFLNGELQSSNATSPYNFADLPAGSYEAKVVDSLDSEAICNAEVTEPEFELTAEYTGRILCFGEPAEISITVTGGSPPYNVESGGEIIIPEGDGTYALSLGVGTNEVIVTDLNGCEYLLEIELEEPPLLEAEFDGEILCHGDVIDVTITATGGTPPFVLWEGAVELGEFDDDTFVLLGRGAGSYSFTVIDANLCEAELDIVLEEPDELIADFEADEILCYGDVVDVTVTVTGGTEPIKLFDGDTEVGTFVDGEFVVTGLGAGSYLWTVRDDSGCEDIVEFTLEEPELLEADFEADEILCYGDVVDVTVTVTGGTEPIKLFDGAIEVGTFVAGVFIVEDLPAGSYSWTVVDANGCEDLVEFELEEPPLLECTVDLVKTADCEVANGSATVVPTGGVGPYTYLWSNGETTATAVELAPGLHTVEVTDANGCITTCEIYIEEEPCVIECETAYGRLDGAYTCFIEDGFGNWGWTNLIEEEGEYSMDLFAAAAHCDPDNGMLVGSVEVVYAGGELTVTYLITEPGISMSEIHTYVGCGKYPTQRNGRETIAPGQYTHNAGLNRAIEYTVTFTDVSGPVYVIAHAVVCTISGTEVVEATNGTSISCGVQIVSQPAQDPGQRSGRAGKSDTIGSDEQSGIRAEVFPNPFRGQATISFGVDRDTRAVVEVYTLQGSRVATLFDAQVQADDSHTVNFSADSQTSHQVYLVVIRTDYGRITKQIISY